MGSISNVEDGNLQILEPTNQAFENFLRLIALPASQEEKPPSFFFITLQSVTHDNTLNTMLIVNIIMSTKTVLLCLWKLFRHKAAKFIRSVGAGDEFALYLQWIDFDTTVKTGKV